MSDRAESLPPSQFLNRELSWLAFNQRVLDEAIDSSNPLLERVKFFCIASSNLDEFFEVRVASLRQQVAGEVTTAGPDGLSPAATLNAVRDAIRSHVDLLYRCWREDLVPALMRERIRFLRVEELAESDKIWLRTFYRERIHPVLTPLGHDQSHPFPLLLNKMLNVVVRLVDRRTGVPVEKIGMVQVPSNLPRLIRLPRADDRHDFLFLGRIIAHFLDHLFPGMEILGSWLIRVTRNGEFYIDPEDTENLLTAVEQELHNRLKGEAVRLEVSHECPDSILELLLEKLDLAPEDIYRIEGPLHPSKIMGISDYIHRPELRDAPFVAPIVAPLRESPDFFAAIRRGDILLHHPYESFHSVIDFLQQAAGDSTVLAIKQTLYRTGGDARIIEALSEAARSGKQVTAIVELKARFDERNNIEWSRKLEEAGVHVVYGIVGLKIHSKVALVVRAEPEGIRRYVHCSTGNYNATTARLYTDLGLLTCRPDFGEDATALFNLLTGICQFRPMRRFLVAPFELHDRMVALIRNEAANAAKGLPARIIAKMNSLVDPATIEALYDASRQGVSIDLIVRGICCLRPGVPGLSENIRVRSIVDRFLEHARVYYFENAAMPRVFLGSADWMPRNFFSRIEVVFPVEDGVLRDRLVSEILHSNLADTVRARLLQPDGTYTRATPPRGTPPHRSQRHLLDRAARSGRPDLEESPGPETGSRGATTGAAPKRPRRVVPRTKPD